MVDLLNASNADELLRDLAIKFGRCGVVFSCKEDNLSNELRQQFVNRLGQLSGKPASSIYIFTPVHNNTSEFDVDDAEISAISSLQRKKFLTIPSNDKDQYDAAAWHSDIQFEPVPAYNTSLRLVRLLETSNDTLRASWYEIYYRFTKPDQKF